MLENPFLGVIVIELETLSDSSNFLVFWLCSWDVVIFYLFFGLDLGLE